MKLIISIVKEVRDEDDARDYFQQITEALENINPELELSGRVTTKLESEGS